MHLPSLVVAAERSAGPRDDPPGGRAWRDAQGAVVGAVGRVGDDHWIRFPGVARYHFRPGRPRVRAVREAGCSRRLTVDTFERSILPFVLQAAGVEVLHASAALGAGGVVAVCGESGAGKSTVAAGLGRRGLTVWADDAVAFEVGGRRATTVGLPFRTRLLPDAEERLRAMARASQGGRREPPEPGRRERLRAIVVLGGGGPGRLAACEVARLTPELAFAALLPHAYWFDLGDPRAKRRTVERYLQLASEVPVHAARVAGLERLPELLGGIERLVRRAPRRPAARGEAG